MAELDVTNWFGDQVSHPAVIVDAQSVDDIVRVLTDPAAYPSPVRAVGSNHSTSRCGAADGGTLIRMKMDRILEIGPDFIRVEAGATHLEMSQALRAKNLQFYVNTEIGSLTAGAAACAGTKDASFAGEFGQVGSYIVGMKLVAPNGQLQEVTPDQTEELKVLRSSYGLLGVVYEVTYRVKPLVPMAVHHETFSLDDFVARLPELWARPPSMMYYFFPFSDCITVEFRNYNPGAEGPPDPIPWALRNYIWGTAGPRFAHDITETVADKAVRYGIVDGFNAILRFKLETLVSCDNTLAPDQIIHYPPVSDDSRYTFSLFAFDETKFGGIFKEFCQFVRDYYQANGYRSNMLYVGYRIAQDSNSLLSYSADGTVMTLDPVSTANEGWPQFLDAYNQFCSDRGGLPLLNQTARLTQPIVAKALGDRLTAFAARRRQQDPTDRLLNPYFRDLLAGA